MTKPRIAIVVQRYGAEVLGGAESYARQLAQKIQTTGHHQVTVYTTTALNYTDWARHYPEGQFNDQDVVVQRFHCRWNRPIKTFNNLSRIMMPLLHRLGRRGFGIASWLEKLWFVMQGPYCPELVQSLHRDAEKYERIYFITYLYYPTVYGLSPKLAHKSIIIPTAHDEPPFYFHNITKLLSRAKAIYAITNGEAELLQRRCPQLEPKISMIGYGIEDPLASQPPQTGIPELPERYILYMGRLSTGKGVHQLLEAFLKHTKTTEGKDSQLHLVLTGKKEADLTIPNHPRIHNLGFVDEAVKNHLITQAAFFINPSPMESLSIVVIEAMLLGRPVLVNAHCPVLEAYAKATPTVYAYRDAREFSNLLNRVHPNSQDLQLSREWALSRFGWQRVLPYFSQPRSERDPGPTEG